MARRSSDRLPSAMLRKAIGWEIKKMVSQLVGEDQNQLPGRRTVWKLGEEEDEEEEPATQQKLAYAD